ncbi:hypothetical protein [Fusobacterium sp. SYSU M8A802]
MERYNLSAEQIVKLLYRKEINRMDNLDNCLLYNRIPRSCNIKFQ